jgi:hypothetical protein
MTRKNLLTQTALISILIIIMLLQLAGANQAQAAAARPWKGTQTYSCIRPASYEVKILCANLEADNLAVTVRIEMHAQYNLQGSSYTKIHPSHATILAGRYLVTHNHFKFRLNATALKGEEGYFAITLRRADGTLILDEAPLSAFKVVHQDPQTLVLEFLNAKGEGLFAAQGLPSADFINWQAITLQPGAELAQIDWNGKQAHVDWVQIDRLDLENSVPQLQVNNFARFGCSGGGVFWNGQHIGNNWARNIEEDSSTNEITRRYSIIALNSVAVANFER